jgi:hypothetical protein
MYRDRHRRPPPFADFINWTDYRWDANPWQRRASGPRTWGQPRPRRRFSVLQVFLAGLAVVLGVKLMSSLRNGGNRSWIEKGVLAVLLIMVANYVARRRRQQFW